MRGLDPRIHLKNRVNSRRWIAGSSPAMTTEGASISSETAPVVCPHKTEFSFLNGNLMVPAGQLFIFNL